MGNDEEKVFPADPRLSKDGFQDQKKETSTEERSNSPEVRMLESSIDPAKGIGSDEQPESVVIHHSPELHGFRRIVLNFTPSWFIITMSTGVVSILTHQLPYNGRWLGIISLIFFALNVALFLTFTLISCIRYTIYPQLIPRVLRHPHQSLFLATFPIGLVTIIIMIVLVCVPAWGRGMATFAWVLWWIASVLSLTTCTHLTWVIMTNRRNELSEMTALYFIPIVAVVAAAAAGGLVAREIPDVHHQLWTLIISYILWGVGTPLSWVILTLYFLRMTIHEPVKREVIVSLLLPIGPLGLSGFSIISFGKLAMRLFPAVHAVPHAADAGRIFYLIGVLAGLILWGFAITWFLVAIIMIATSGGFSFNMGWWGFIFPVGVFTLLTITLGEEMESRFFKILSCVFTGMLVVAWLIIAAGTLRNSLTGKMFFSPCLGTDLFQKENKQITIGRGKRKETV
ncbi:hypothetical protein ACLMJK_002979 [Lecanora helva]